jgi:hypothetical protein
MARPARRLYERNGRPRGSVARSRHRISGPFARGGGALSTAPRSRLLAFGGIQLAGPSAGAVDPPSLVDCVPNGTSQEPLLAAYLWRRRPDREILHGPLNGPSRRRGADCRLTPELEANRMPRIFLAKAEIYAIPLDSRRSSPCPTDGEQGEANGAATRFRQRVYNLRWRLEIFSFESAVTH